jgi:hypothetical protein
MSRETISIHNAIAICPFGFSRALRIGLGFPNEYTEREHYDYGGDYFFCHIFWSQTLTGNNPG